MVIMQLFRKCLLLMIFSFVIPCSGLYAMHDTLNQYDSNGNKHGYWKTYRNNALAYEGRFEHGKPTGLFVYYFRNEQIKATLKYSENGRIARAVTFYPSGQVMAVGKYVDQKKDSIWDYYNELGIHLSTESYENGKPHGKWKTYNYKGKVIEIINYENGEKEGEWKQFFDNGKKKLKATYRAGKLEGAFWMYYSNGRFSVVGRYKNSFATGLWTYYNSRGEVEKKVTYEEGRVVKTEHIREPIDIESEENQREIREFRRQLRMLGLEDFGRY